MRERENVMVVPVHKSLVRSLVAVCPRVLHSVLFLESLYLAVTEHGKTGHGNHQRADTEIFVSLTELSHSSLLVGIVHEVHESLQNLRVKLDCVLNRVSVLLVLFLLEHVHECGVVDAVHSESAGKISLHHPESLGKQKCVGHLLGTTVHHFPPELIGQCGLKLLGGKGVLASCRNVSTMTRLRVPQSPDMFFRKDHRCVKTDDREIRGHLHNLSDNGLPRRGIQKINLRGVIPGHSRSVVSVVDVGHVPGLIVHTLEANRTVALRVIVVLKIKGYASVLTQVLTVEAVLRERTVLRGDKIIGMLHHPPSVHSGVIRNHVGRKTDSAGPAPSPQIIQRAPSAEVSRNLVVQERICRSRRLRISVNLLDSP